MAHKRTPKSKNVIGKSDVSIENPSTWKPSYKRNKVSKSVIFQSDVDSTCMGAVVRDCLEKLEILSLLQESSPLYKHIRSTWVTPDCKIDLGRINQVAKACALNPEDTLLKSLSKPSLSRREQSQRLVLLSSRHSEYGKVTEDRAFLHKVLEELEAELKESNSFQSLASSIKSERIYRKELQAAVNKLEESKSAIQVLEENLRKAKLETQTESKERDGLITHLRERVGDIKTRCTKERKYELKLHDVKAQQQTNKCMRDESLRRNYIKALADKLDEEESCHKDIMAYLDRETERLNFQRVYWIEKYNEEFPIKTAELEQLKAKRVKDSERMQELGKLFAEYEQVVIDNRITQEELRREVELEKIRLKATTRIQAWWRGTMVRKHLGPFRRKKKSSAKKGKKKVK